MGEIGVVEISGGERNLQRGCHSTSREEGAGRYSSRRTTARGLLVETLHHDGLRSRALAELRDCGFEMAEGEWSIAVSVGAIRDQVRHINEWRARFRERYSAVTNQRNIEGGGRR